MTGTAERRRWWVLAVLCLAVLIVVIDNTIVNVALPVLSRDLRASNASLQWIVDAYSLPFAGLLFAGAGLSDRLGRKRVMLVALGAFGAFSLVAATSHDVASLLVARALMGASAAFIFPATLSTLTIAFDDHHERSRAFGVWGAASGVAIAIGPVVGGALLVNFWYGSIFLINAPLVLVAIGAAAAVVPESTSPTRHALDLVGLGLGTGGVTALTFAIIQGPTWGWLDASTLALFAAALAALVAFVAYERRCEGPLLDLSVFRSATFSSGAGAVATNFFCLFGFIFLFTQYFQLIRGYSPLSAGVHTLPFAIVVIVATPLGASLALRLGARYLVSLGLLIVALALAGADFVGAQSSYFGPVLGLMALLALGFSLVNAPSTASLMNTLRPEQVGAGSAVNETTRELAGTLGVAIVGSVFSSLFAPRVRDALEPFRARGLSAAGLRFATTSTKAAQVVVGHFPPRLRPALDAKIASAFMDGLHHGAFVAAGIAFAMAFVALRYLPAPASSLAVAALELGDASAEGDLIT